MLYGVCINTWLPPMILSGTVQGGIQLQDFKSVGTRLFDTNRDLYLPHNITIHISVVAVNGAGLRTISYSDPVRVDLTPPEFEYVNDGIQEGKQNLLSYP